MFQENKARQIFRKINISYPLIWTRTGCFVFLKLPFWDSSFCFITGEFCYYLVGQWTIFKVKWNLIFSALFYFKSSRPEVFLGKAVLKIWSKFTGEHQWWSVNSIKLLSNFIEITLQQRCSPLNLLHIFRTLFLKNISGRLLLLILDLCNPNLKSRWELIFIVPSLAPFLFIKNKKKNIIFNIMLLSMITEFRL